MSRRRREQLVPVLKPLEEEISLIVQPAPKLLGVHQGVIGNPELLPGFRHVVPPRGPAEFYNRRASVRYIARMFSVGVSSWMLWDGERTYPPCSQRIRRHPVAPRRQPPPAPSAGEGTGCRCRRGRRCLLPKSLFRPAGSIPFAAGCRGLRMSTPLAMSSGIDLPDRPAGMEHHLDPFPVHDIRHALQGLEDVAVHRLAPHEKPLLRAQVREGPEHVDLSACRLHRPMEVLDEKRYEALLEVVHHVLVDHDVHEDVLQAPHEAGPLEEVRVPVEDGVPLVPPDIVPDARVVHLVAGRPGKASSSARVCASKSTPRVCSHSSP